MRHTPPWLGTGSVSNQWMIRNMSHEDPVPDVAPCQFAPRCNLTLIEQSSIAAVACFPANTSCRAAGMSASSTTGMACCCTSSTTGGPYTGARWLYTVLPYPDVPRRSRPLHIQTGPAQPDAIACTAARPPLLVYTQLATSTQRLTLSYHQPCNSLSSLVVSQLHIGRDGHRDTD